MSNNLLQQYDSTTDKKNNLNNIFDIEKILPTELEEDWFGIENEIKLKQPKKLRNHDFNMEKINSKIDIHAIR
ncbi:hypothetical protein [Acanthamoeba polyphaga mimivirus]|uniref:Uncharacterized protein n=1 Tax=Acanthamoeba polyphaga mimivirus TaxID=212035 RepID=A0A2L2DKV4_MIMIV|nr:hypothetical protein [Acanthamoeba polyphaga mimivirus]